MRDVRDVRDVERREGREGRGGREGRDVRDVRDMRDVRDVRDVRGEGCFLRPVSSQRSSGAFSFPTTDECPRGLRYSRDPRLVGAVCCCTR